MRRFITITVSIFWILLSGTLNAVSQDEAEKSTLITYVEEQISSPNMQIRLNGITGTLSSDVSFQSITISDDDGVWLTVTEPRLIWSRSALLRGRLEIESLQAKRIDIPRGPLPDESAPSPEARSFSIPELPVAVNLQKLSVPVIVFGKQLFGLAAQASVEGSIVLGEGSLDTKLSITRLEDPGGDLKADINYQAASKKLALDVTLQEPQDGIVANLLNLEGQPPVALAIRGDAPVDDLRVQLAFDVGSQRILNGNLALDDVADGLQAKANLGGPLSDILSSQYKQLLGDSSALDFVALFGANGAIELSQLNLRSGVVALTATASILSDGFLSALNLDASLLDRLGNPVTFQGADGLTRFDSAQLTVAYDAQANGEFKTRLRIVDVESDELSFADINLATEGTVSNFGNAALRSLEFVSRGSVTDIEASDPALNEALGKQITIDGRGSWKSGEPLSMAAFDIEGENFALRTNGQLQSFTFEGQIGLETDKLRSFSAMTGRDLAGSLGLVASGKIQPVTGAFDLDFRGVGNRLEIGAAIADALLEGSTNLSGGIARSAEGISFERFRITNNQTDLLLDGTYADENSDLAATVELRNLADISDSGRGAVSLEANIAGQSLPYDMKAQIKMPRGDLGGKQVIGLFASFVGKISPGLLVGALAGGGEIDRQAVSLSGEITRREAELTLKGLIANIGQSKISANINRKENTGLIDGEATIRSSDIGALAALAFKDASGTLDAEVKLNADGIRQNAAVDLEAKNLVVENSRIESANISAKIADLFGTPEIDAQIDGRNAIASGITIKSIEGAIMTVGDVTDFDVSAELSQNNSRLKTQGSFDLSDGKQRIALNTLDLQSNVGNARLSAPTAILLMDGRATFSDAQLRVEGGSITLNGTAGEALDLDVAVSQLPLSIANTFRPDLQLRGEIDATIQAKGSVSAPTAQFSISATNFSASQLASAQIAPLSVNTQGKYDGAAAIVNINQLAISNAQQIAVTGAGQIPLSGSGLSFAAEGTAPLAIAERFIADRGARIAGRARFNINAAGALASPTLSGLLSVSDGSLTDPLSNLRLTNIGLLADLDGDQINIQKFNAQLASGGSISSSGTVGISGALPANLSVTLSNARYGDGQTFLSTMDGRLALTGSLSRDPLLSGDINLAETEILVPETISGSSDLLNVKHVSPDAATRTTLDRIARATPLPTPGSRPSILQLDVNINAPARIFVRGRGLDAELGGRISIRGPSTNVVPSGRFDLRRGRLQILGQRFDLDEGSVILLGDLDPALDFTVSTQTGDVTAFINLKGRASDLEVTFTSSPELPQDEVLARIIFDRGISDLSPTQIARLASIALELTGGNSPGFVDGIRDGLGLDDLDVVQDSDGNAAVKAGKYVADNVYLGVQTGQDTEATINLDITDSLTARGSVDSSGESSLGIFFEKDY